MTLGEIGGKIRRFRLARGLTQAQVAAAAGVTRTTVNQLENGVVKDLGIRKVQTILDQVGLVLKLGDASLEPKSTDYLRAASTSASVSFKDTMSEKELLHALLTGNVPPGRRPHLRALLEETRGALLEGLIRQVTAWTRPGKVERNLDKIAAEIGVEESVSRWRTKSN